MAKQAKKDEISFFNALKSRSPSPASPTSTKELKNTSPFKSLSHENAEKLKKSSSKFLEQLRKILEKNTASLDILNENFMKFKQFCDKNRKYLDDLFEKTNLVSLIIGRFLKFNKDQAVSSKEKLRKTIKLTLLSCLADLCFYEKLRNHMQLDENFEDFIKSFSNETDESIWSKICRLCANFCQDMINIKYFINDGKFVFYFRDQ